MPSWPGQGYLHLYPHLAPSIKISFLWNVMSCIAVPKYRISYPVGTYVSSGM